MSYNLRIYAYVFVTCNRNGRIFLKIQTWDNQSQKESAKETTNSNSNNTSCWQTIRWWVVGITRKWWKCVSTSIRRCHWKISAEKSRCCSISTMEHNTWPHVGVGHIIFVVTDKWWEVIGEGSWFIHQTCVGIVNNAEFSRQISNFTRRIIPIVIQARGASVSIPRCWNSSKVNTVRGIILTRRGTGNIWIIMTSGDSWTTSWWPKRWRITSIIPSGMNVVFQSHRCNRTRSETGKLRQVKFEVVFCHTIFYCHCKVSTCPAGL